MVYLSRWAAVWVTAAGVLRQSSFAENRWEVPLAGNAYLTSRAEGGGDGWERGGWRWRDRESRWSVYFHVDRPAMVDLGLRAGVAEGEAKQGVKVWGGDFEVVVAGRDPMERNVGKIEIKAPGYVRVDLRGLDRTGPDFGRVTELLVRSSTSGLELTYVRSDENNMFYWGRRGPSVHLAYEVPKGLDIEYAYSELTIPEGGDPVGSFYMANGFGEGYFGIQTRSNTERWVIFSVWSPFQTDDPQKIPESDRVHMAARARRSGWENLATKAPAAKVSCRILGKPG